MFSYHRPKESRLTSHISISVRYYCALISCASMPSQAGHVPEYKYPSRRLQYLKKSVCGSIPPLMHWINDPTPTTHYFDTMVLIHM